MELGPVLALLSAAVFGGMGVLIRRGVYQSEESTTAAAISAFVGTPLFLFILPLTGDWNRLWSLSWQGFASLGIAGILHFVLGRYLLFNAIRLIGANKTVAIARTDILFAVIFGIVFLREAVTTLLILGALCIMAGAALVSFEKEQGAFKLQIKGVLFVLSGALCVGVAAVLIRSAMEEVGSPYIATFISYMTAFLLWTILLLQKGQRDQLFQLPRSSLFILSMAAILGLVGQLLRYAALNYSPVSVVQPLIGTVVLFTFFLSFMLNRSIDVFNWRVFLGIVVVLTGTFLLFL
jgi:drug/metabolite transporter (DMT)-like permease